MIKFYTNVFREKNLLYVRGRDFYGKRVNEVVKYKPYLFIPSPKPSKYKNLKGEYVDRVDFDSMYEAGEFMKKYKDVSNFSVFGYNKFEYVYIADTFKNLEFSLDQISTGFIDIEVHSTDGFPDPDTALHMVTCISIKKKNKTYVLYVGKLDFSDIADANTHFFSCIDEKDLLAKFLTLWEKLDFDVISGWNIDGFDMKYIYNRICNLFSVDEARRLSPYRKVHKRTTKIMGKDVTFITIKGISILDYLDLYKKFTQGERDSYTLNNIAYIELNEKKVDYSEYESLADLWIKNPKKYIKYNIHDTELVSRFENKLGFIELAITIAYDAKINFDDSMGSVLLWEVLIMNYLGNKNIVMPSRSSPGSFGKILGAHVKEPLKGLHEWVVSFDLTSLYPHIIMGWNISPETFVKKISNNVNIELMLEKSVPTEELKRMNVTMAANNCMYRKDINGFLADLMAHQFDLRSEYKKKMIAAEKAFEKTKDPAYELEAAKYYNYQWAKKIQLNSAYGSVSNVYFAFYDLDNAEAITITGQLIIRWAEKKINAFLNDWFKTSKVDYVIASDTDSLYLNLAKFVKDPTKPKKEIVDELDEFGKSVITKAFSDIFKELTEMMNCSKNALFMKRENIIEKAIWRAKKNYAALVWDSEGVRYSEPELKIVGLESVRSNVPEVCRKKIKEAIEIMFDKGKLKVYDFVDEFWKEYKSLSVQEIARPISVKDLDSYKTGNSDGPYAKGAPHNVKAAILYNKYLIDNQLLNKYPLISNGDKIKFVSLVKHNPIGDDIIGAPDGNFPKELKVEEYVDYEVMFEKTFHSPVKSLLEAAGWEPEMINSLEGFM